MTSQEIFSGNPELLSSQSPRKGLLVNSKLLNALNKFTGGLAVSVENPLRSKYGEAYDYLITGDLHAHRDELETAKSYYEHALSLRSDLREACVGIGKCMKRQGDVAGAISYFKKALSANAFDKELLLEVAKSYTEIGELGKAITYYQRSVKVDPHYIEALFGLALVVEIDGDLMQAIGIYKKIVEIDSDFLPAYNNLGSLYMRMSMYDASEQLFTHLIERAPEFSRGYLGLAITMDKAGKKKEALIAYHQVLEMRPNSKNAEFIERRIIQLNKEIGHCKSSRATTLVRIK